MTSQSDISLLLTFRAEMIDPSLPTGLWWCATPEDAAAVGINAVCKNRYAAWEDLAACTEFITQFCYVFVATPNDADREEIVSCALPTAILKASTTLQVSSLCWTGPSGTWTSSIRWHPM